MLYKAKKRLIEAANDEEAENILGTRDFKRYERPSMKAFIMWLWLRAGKKDGRVIKWMMGMENPNLEEYRENPNIVRNELRKAGMRLSDWAMIGEEGYDAESHSELFYRKEIPEA